LMSATTGVVDCCARAVIGHVAAAPPMAVMNSRRLIASPRLRTKYRRGQNSTLEVTAVRVQVQIVERPAMSELGQSLPKLYVRVTSALHPIATE
jgi:hypothetical protein